MRLKLQFISVLACFILLWECINGNGDHINLKNKGKKTTSEKFFSGESVPNVDSEKNILSNYKKTHEINPAKVSVLDALLLNKEASQNMTKIKADEKDTSVISVTVESSDRVFTITEDSMLTQSSISSVPFNSANKVISKKNKLVDENLLFNVAKVVDSEQRKTNEVSGISFNTFINNKNKKKTLKNNFTSNRNLTDTPKTESLSRESQTNSLPDIITEVPLVKVTELQKNQDAEHMLNNDANSEIRKPCTEEVENAVYDNQTDVANDTKNDETQQDGGRKFQINDPGGVTGLVAEIKEDASIAYILTEAGSNHSQNSTLLSNETKGNLTLEEVPIPVFSEWAQKQMEAEASKMQALEQEQLVANNSAQRRNNTNANGKPQPLKVRSKNYASPDCGAKIIAANPDADHIGAVLTNSRDEYMLNPCGTRIWFVVELCEAIQAQKVELANFELFSSSPKNFTVAIANRFPTRDWSNVGRFTAEDKRNVQSFDLHPHLFGKFVRIDIHTHYSKEHFCPVSLFRAFGTSEFEAFETEIRAGNDLDDFDDEEELAQAKRTDNIFKSASDAVLQMVKKAAEVLVKPSAYILRQQSRSSDCRSPAFGLFSCKECNDTLVERINIALSCEFHQLQDLVSLTELRNHLLTTRVCADDYKIDLMPMKSIIRSPATIPMYKKQSYFLNILPDDFIGALCKLLSEQDPWKQDDIYENSTLSHSISSALIDNKKKLSANFQMKSNERNLPEEKSFESIGENPLNVTSTYNECTDLANENNRTMAEDSAVELKKNDVSINQPTQYILESTLSLIKSKSTNEISAGSYKNTATPTSAPDVNIFNIAAGDTNLEYQVPPAKISTPLTEDVDTETASETSETEDIFPPEEIIRNSDEDSSNWESIDNLLTTTVASLTAGGSAAAAAVVMHSNIPEGGSGTVHMQQKLSHSAQSESVFIRLSNRVKVLERNMSLSGQYLEELSRRYKKQVEELQHTLSQQSLRVRSLEEQSRRFIELEKVYQLQNSELTSEIRNLTFQVQFCIGVFILVGTCVFLMLVLGYVFYRKLRQQTQEFICIKATDLGNPINMTKPKQRQLYRRKSYEDFSDQSAVNKKQRRPSEEAMLILKGCGNDLKIGKSACNDIKSLIGNQRQRKISICHPNNTITAKMGSRASLGYTSKQAAKQSWFGGLNMQPATNDMDKYFDKDAMRSSDHHHPRTELQIYEDNNKPGKFSTKKNYFNNQLPFIRQASAPNAFTNGALLSEMNNSDFEEQLILDDDDLNNFIPNSDLAYNEFMPEGPSGYQIVDTTEDVVSIKKDEKKASRRLSSPGGFFKSPFGKIMSKSTIAANKIKAHSVHEPTAWEWYRLKRSTSEAQQKFTCNLPKTSLTCLDTSSLSEINFPINTTQNSFRILEKAILTSGDVKALSKRNPNGNASSSSSGNSSNRSTSSTSSSVAVKKKNRSLNKIFRNVF